MITLERCKEVLNTGKKKYNNDEIKEIRDYLYFLAELQIEVENNKYNSNSVRLCNLLYGNIILKKR